MQTKANTYRPGTNDPGPGQMTTVQIIGIAVASLVVLLLVVALLLTRRRGKEPDAEAQPGGGSFLDDAPQDTFAGLGRAEQPVEDVTLDPGVQRERAAAASAAVAAAAAAQPSVHEPAAGGLGLDWGPDLSVTTLSSPPAAPRAARVEPPAEQPKPPSGPSRPAPAAETDETETTGEMAVPAASDPAPMPTPPGSSAHLVPLSDIIVTTSNKMVDLQDAEVRHMLTDLVTYEIDQAAAFRRRGQTIDAVLQLTEAEKVSRALGMSESAERIRTMMAEIEGSR